MSTPPKSVKANPPMKGSFPLDHKNVCENEVNYYFNCLQSQELKGSNCRDLAKKYLECRMNNGLMLKEDWNNLGFSNEEIKKK